MPLLVFRPRLYDNTAENLQFRCLCEELKKRISLADQHKKPEICLFVGNFNFSDKDFDAFLIKRNAIILIEFKNYGGKITVSNNKWECEYEGKTGLIKGGAGDKSPYEQAKNNRNAFKRNMVNSMTLTEEQAKKIASLVVFNHNCEIENNLRLNIQTWLHVCDNKGFYGSVESIVNKDFNFSAKDLRKIAHQLVLDDDYIIEEYSDMEFFETWNNPELLNEYSQLLEGEITFPAEPDPFEEINEEVKEEEEEKKPAESNIPQIISLYIQQIMSTALPGVAYTIVDCEEEKPHVGFDIDQKYLIQVTAEPNEDNRNALSCFIKKQVYADEHSLFWTFGEKITTIAADVPDTSSIDVHQPRRTQTMLPPWLDSFIYETMFALYDPRYKRHTFNHDLNEEEARIYLGTYFPRSYAETFLIFDNLFSNEKYKAEIERKGRFVVLSIGSGSGGDIMGLLVAIDKHLSPSIPVSVISLDINTHSLAIQRTIISRFRSISPRTIQLSQVIKEITGKDTFHEYAESAFEGKEIDFLLFSKVGYELHSKGLFGDTNVYYEMLSAFMNKTSPYGVAAIIDSTTMADSEEYVREVLSRGVNKFTSAFSDFSTLLPLSCNNYERQCIRPCFCKQEISVTHCKKIRDISKISYRVIARTALTKKIVRPRKFKYIMTPSQLNEINCETYCYHSLSNKEEFDAFNIN